MFVFLNFQEDASRQKVISLCQFHEARRPSTYTYKILFLLLKKIRVSTSKTNRLILLWSVVTLHSTKIKTFTNSLRSAHTDCMCVLYGSENKPWLFPWAVLKRYFRNVRKTVKSDYQLGHNVCLSAWNSAPTRRIFMKFDIWVFLENLLIKF
jgi:hypothetical protein